ncbi:MAG: inositol monophosphatase [Planctomycetota bacterium]|nr:MAG: inositol monophosphatase [Planctomycetota bacterium]
MTDSMLDFAVSLARDAGKMLSERFADFRGQKVDYKGKRDLVTQADTDLENFIVPAIRKEFPNHDILAEESQSSETGSTYRWIIDPLDGTTNFAHGHPFVSVSIALMVDGALQLGVVAAPMLDAVYAAERGCGANRNGAPIHVSDVSDLLHALVATGFAYNRHESEANNIDNFSRIVTEVQGIRRCGSAAIDLCLVASGVYDAFWELWLAPWDVAAGSIIVREAGGTVTDLDGKDNFIYGRNIVASNGRLHETVRSRLTGADNVRREIKNM